MAILHARHLLVAPFLLLCLSLDAQTAGGNSALAPLPSKGRPDSSPVTPEELARLHGQRAQHATLPNDAAGISPLRCLVFDRTESGELWAAGPAYKASFGRNGFTFVPFFGSDAPRAFPVRFELTSVRVGGTDLPLAPAEPQQDGMFVSFGRGAVLERYELSLADVEQTFVIDSPLAGDVDIELRVHSELREDVTRDGIQFASPFGTVDYGRAHVVAGEQLVPVATTSVGDSIRIHVPAALRGAGPLVVDPIVHASPLSVALTQNSSQPDIAYDETTDQFLVVWQYAFTATDNDVYCEFRSGGGSQLPGTVAAIDVSNADFQRPRVANLNAYNQFLVVAQRFVGGGWQIWGRFRIAGQPVSSGVFAISDPAAFGQSWNPDIGGDSSSNINANRFLVVWEQQVTATDYDIVARMVRTDGVLPFVPFGLADGANSVYTLPSVSQSNGNGFSVSPRWLVVYQYRFSAVDSDIFGCSVDALGTVVSPNQVIDGSGLHDLYPAVASPNTDLAGGNLLYLVTYERQAPSSSQARLLSSALVNTMVPVDLTAQLSLNAFWIQAESDGNRFCVTHGGFGALAISTLAFDGTTLVVQDVVVVPGSGSYPRICSKRSGGGQRTQYGVIYLDEAVTPDRVMVTLYSGRVAGADLLRRFMGCGGLGISQVGSAFLGESFTFTLTNVAFEISGFAFGTSVPASPAFCAACPLGVSPNGVLLLPGPTLTIAVPTTLALVGYTAGVQGFALGSGPCPLALRFSDTFDIVIR